MIENCAPILIPTLNRYEHFKRCVNSLKECEFSSNSDLFIALDYPLKDSHWKGYVEILNFIDGLNGFKSVNIIKREYNMGAYKNSEDALKFIFSKYDILIFTEDDNVFSKDFLHFINTGLSKYRYNEQIFSICGYNYPTKMPKSYKDEIYIWQGYSAWGVGLWRDKFLKIDWSEEIVQSSVKDFLKNYFKIFEFNKIANIYLPALLNMYNRKLIHGDIYICMNQFLNNMYSVFPVQSRVRNIGNDGSGENCVILEDDIYASQEMYQGSNDYVLNYNMLPNNEINNVLKKHFKSLLKSKILILFILIMTNLGLYETIKVLKNKWIKIK
jgi:hypothetical protein